MRRVASGDGPLAHAVFRRHKWHNWKSGGERERGEGRSTTAPPEQMSSIPPPPCRQRCPPRSKLEMNERRTIIKFATHEITNAWSWKVGGWISMHAVTEWGWSFLIKQHLFPAIRRVSTLFGRATSATCLGGALLSITGSLPTCIPSRSEERRGDTCARRCTWRTCARRGGKMFQGQNEEQRSPKGYESILVRQLLSLSKPKIGG